MRDHLKLPFLISIKTQNDVESLRENISSFRKSAGQYIRNLEGEYSPLKSKLEEFVTRIQELNSDINSQKTRLDTAITQFQQQFSASESSRSTQFLEDEKLRLDEFTKLKQQFVDAIADCENKLSIEDKERNNQFQEILDSTNESFIEDRNNHKLEFAKLHSDLKTEHETMTTGIYADAQGFITNLESMRDKAQQLVNIITNSGIASGFRDIANKERTSARYWHSLTVISAIGLIGFAIFAFAVTAGSEFKWGVFAGRAFVALTFGVLFAYAARMAEKREEVERHNRKIELDLIAINPFVAELPSEIQNELKKQLADRLFGHQEVKKDGASTSSAPTGTVTDFVKTISDSLKALVELSGKK